MVKIKVSEKSEDEFNVKYIYNALKNTFSDLECKAEMTSNEHRAEMIIFADEKFADYIRMETEEKIAEIIAVGYKAEFLSRTAKATGLEEIERELLLDAIISADLEDDKKYILRKLRHFSEYAIDGLYNFRLIPLKRKWEEIAGYIPPYFSKDRLKDFIKFLLDEKREKTATIDGGVVYDETLKPVSRTSIIGQSGRGRILKEAILSGCGRVKLLSSLGETDEKYLKEYFGDNVL